MKIYGHCSGHTIGEGPSGFLHAASQLCAESIPVKTPTKYFFGF